MDIKISNHLKVLNTLTSPTRTIKKCFLLKEQTDALRYAFFFKKMQEFTLESRVKSPTNTCLPFCSLSQHHNLFF